MKKILYLATADARGHLMRAQLLTHHLEKQGIIVELLTTSDEGQRFFEVFGLSATIFTRSYYVEFDDQQNMQESKTNRRIARYCFFPWYMLADIMRLKRMIGKNNYALIINDSFHPALIHAPFLGVKNVVHIHGETLKRSLYNNFDVNLKFIRKMYHRYLDFFLSRAKGELVHGQAIDQCEMIEKGWRLPNPIQAPSRSQAETYVHYKLITDRPLAIIYLNPHFQNSELILKLEALLRENNWQFIGISEYFGNRPHWQKFSDDFANLVHASDLLISAGGMAALKMAKIQHCPLIAISTNQPEQAQNLNMFKHSAPFQILMPNLDTSWKEAHDFLETLANHSPEKPSLAEIINTIDLYTDHWLTALNDLMDR